LATRDEHTTVHQQANHSKITQDFVATSVDTIGECLLSLQTEDAIHLVGKVASLNGLSVGCRNSAMSRKALFGKLKRQNTGYL
jgi:hypothetical protein